MLCFFRNLLVFTYMQATLSRIQWNLVSCLIAWSPAPFSPLLNNLLSWFITKSKDRREKFQSNGFHSEWDRAFCNICENRIKKNSGKWKKVGNGVKSNNEVKQFNKQEIKWSEQRAMTFVAVFSWGWWILWKSTVQVMLPQEELTITYWFPSQL